MGRVWPRHGHRGRPLNSVVRQHQSKGLNYCGLRVAFRFFSIARGGASLNTVAWQPITPGRGVLAGAFLLSNVAGLEAVLPNNAFERTVEHRGPRLAAARAAGPAAQLGRYTSECASRNA